MVNTCLVMQFERNTLVVRILNDQSSFSIRGNARSILLTIILMNNTAEDRKPAAQDFLGWDEVCSHVSKYV